MLNPALYTVLKSRFRDVRVSHQGEKRVERYNAGGSSEVIERGETYAVNCPVCGDTKHRLSISYLWLERKGTTGQIYSHLAHCYNEGCPVTKEKFYGPILAEIQAVRLGFLPELAEMLVEPVAKQKQVIRLPVGFTLLDKLNSNHHAIQFLKAKYNGFDPIYLSKHYSVGYTDEPDQIYAYSKNRIIFPIFRDGKVIAWQGRAVDAQQTPRWYLPPGFVKTFYNMDRVPELATPIISEGIPASIACGPNGIAIFGKELSDTLCREFAEKWKSAIIALDPETFVPDNRKGANGRIFAHELRDRLSKYVSVKCIRWPKHVLELATMKCNGKDITVPDAADLGFTEMHKLLKDL